MFDKFKSAVDKYKIDMILQRFKYSEFSGQPQEWRLEEFSLEKVNLLVGKNATGKTHTISAI
ncbi:MAG: hypothetical protein LBS69_06145, partial [Prevotellaceae bacterium]|nr:hypothetical protein [Prevotellaceae bacterium]